MEKFSFDVDSRVISCVAPVMDEDNLSQVLCDRYRCPDNFFDFDLNRKLSTDLGYFRFGPNAICYGRSSAGPRASSPEAPLCDALTSAVVKEGKLGLTFDPSEIVETLREERYPRRRLSVYDDLLKRIYYWLRPFTNQFVREQIQRFYARNWQKLSFPRWPLDTTVENLCETLLLLSLQAKSVESVPFVWFWPRGARGCVLMTHDVETTAGRDFCPNLLDLDDSYGIKASFQIVPEERYEVPPKLLDTIRNHGFEVGVQDLNHDGRLYDNRAEFLRRAKKINRYGAEWQAKGFRAGVLYRKPEWFDSLDFSYEMSIPNVAHLDPQPGGCCTVMPYFIENILEIPVTAVQDYTLFHILRCRSIDLWKTQTKMILQKYGLVSFIVHPDYIIEQETRSLYEDLLRYLQDVRSQRDIWFALPHEINSWWRMRSEMRLEKHGNSWKIVGDGAERAVLAYAKNIDGKLTYEPAGTTVASVSR